MGAGASSGPGNSPSPARHGNAGSPLQTSDKNTSVKGGTSYSGAEQARRANLTCDYPSPKPARHVVINASDQKKLQQRGGGLIDKLLQKASLSTSPAQSSTTSYNGSVAGSDKSQASPRSRRRDDYDVDSEDEDLEGFIYDDDSTSEDEREDYVNAFSRRRKQPTGGADDYRDHEGAALRALTTAQRRSRVRRTRSSTAGDEDGNDEYDPEEQAIRQLRHLKKQEDRAKAEALTARKAAAAASYPGPGVHGRSVVAGDGRPEPGPASQQQAAAAAVQFSQTPGPPQQRHPQPAPQPQQQAHQQLQPYQQSRMAPQPPLKPPARGNSGSNLRRNVAAANTATGSIHCGGAPGPGPGPGLGGGATTVATTATAATTMGGSGGRPTAAPQQQVNYGASASSQYWQERRTQNDGGAGDTGEADEHGVSRLEQLAVLQRKRQQAVAMVNIAVNGLTSDPSGGTGGKAEGRAVEAAARVGGHQTQVQEAESNLVGRLSGSSAHVQVVSNPRGADVRVAEPGRGGGGGRLEAAALSHEREDGPAAASAMAVQKQQLITERERRQPHSHSQSQPGYSQCGSMKEPLRPSKRSLEGQSFIQHLEPPPPRRQVHKTKSRGVLASGRGAAAAAAAEVQASASPRPALISRQSDGTDFDVDEVLGTFAPTVQGTTGIAGTAALLPHQHAQWTVSRPQPPQHQSPVQKRSIRAVQSDFASKRPGEVEDSIDDLTGRVLSLPLPTSQPVASGCGGAMHQGMATWPAKPTVTSAPVQVQVSRFARLGATLAGQQGIQDGHGPSNGPVALAVPGASTVSNTAIGDLASCGGGAVPSPVRRPRRSNASNDGTSLITSSMPTLPWDGSGLMNPAAVAGAGGGSVGQVSYSHAAANRDRKSMSSGGGRDAAALVFAVLHPGSGGGGGNAVGGGDGDISILNAVGRNRFGAVQHQQWQQEAAQRTQPVTGPSKRDYESDSAVTRGAGGQARYSYNDDGSRAAILSMPGFKSGPTTGGPFGAPAHGRLGQVGA